MTTQTKTKIGVADTTGFSFRMDWEEFNTIQEAFAYIASEIEEWADDDSYGDCFEIKIPGAEAPIQIDARHVDYTELFDLEEIEED